MKPITQKGSGRDGLKRRRIRGNSVGITKGAIRRLARRGGVKRIAGPIYDLIRCVLKAFLENVISDAMIYCEYGKRKLITSTDVIYALKRHGQTLYGFEDY
uniref:Histone H4 n=1 Tax=Bracon brevicornis TaxID=1563983 RepID=A0A6V7JU22_9HYME